MTTRPIFYSAAYARTALAETGSVYVNVYLSTDDYSYFGQRYADRKYADIALRAVLPPGVVRQYRIVVKPKAPQP